MAKDVSIIVKAIDQVTGPLGQMRSGFSAFAGVIRGVGATIVGSAIGKFLKDSVDEGVKAEDSYRRLGAALKNTGNNLQALKPSIDTVVDSVQKLSNQTDDDLRNALTKLISTTGDVGGSMKNLGLVADVAAERHIDLEAAALLVGKTMNGNLTPLMKAYGVHVKTAAEGTALLHEKTDGFAKTATEGMGGALTNLNIQWGEFKEAIGLAIIGSDGLSGSTDRLAGALVDLQKWVKENEGNIGAFIDKMIRLGEAIGKVGKFVVEHTPNWYTAGKAMGVFGDDAENTAKKVDASQTTMTGATKTGAANRIVLTEEEKKAREAAVKKSHDNLNALEDTANKSALELLSASQKAHEEVERTFRKKMEGMTKADYAKAEALLKTTHKNQLLAWAGFNAEWEAGAGKVAKTQKEEIPLVGGLYTDFNDILKKHGKQLSENEQKTLNTTLRWGEFKEQAAGLAFEIAGAADGMLGFIENAGLADDQTRQLFTSVGDLAEGIGRIAAGDIAGGLVQGISGLSGAIAGLFGGESASARAVRLELERTQEELERHRRTLGDLIEISTPGAKTENIAGGVQNILATWAGMQAKGGAASVLSGVDAKTVGRELAKLGLTIADLEDLAEQLGIDLHPGGSKLFSTDQLNAVLADLGTRDSGFAQTFEGQRERQRDRQRISGASSQQQLIDLVELATGQFGSSALAGALQGADLSTAAGRGGAIGNLLSLFDRGDLTGEELGGLNLEQLRDVILEIADLIRGLGEITDVINLPVGTGGPGIPDVPGGIDRLPGELGDAVPFGELFGSLSMPMGESVDLLASIDANLALLTKPPGEAGGLRGVSIEIGSINVSGVGAGVDGEAIGADIARGISMEMARVMKLDQQVHGSVVQT